MRLRAVRLVITILSLLIAVSCEQKAKAPQEVFDKPLEEALSSLGLNEEALSVPRLGNQQVSTPGRLMAVDSAMHAPLTMIQLSHRIAQVNRDLPPAEYVSQSLALYGVRVESPAPDFFAPRKASEVWDELSKASLGGKVAGKAPAEWDEDSPFYRALCLLLFEEAVAQQAYRKAVTPPPLGDPKKIQEHLLDVVRKKEPKPEEQRWLMPKEYHRAGAYVNLAELATALVRLQAAVEHVLPDLKKAAASSPSLRKEWVTPLGRVRMAGAGKDKHSGDFLLLIDLGGDDAYEDVGRLLGNGGVSVVIDMAGNDNVRWAKTPGAGAGVMGIALWADLAGDDRYAGGNLGQGTGLLGAGLLWDAEGNDTYEGGSLVQGMGEYGIGVLIDTHGNDRYQAAIGGQGFGGPGGIGILADLGGNDAYSCGNVVPDQAEERISRHSGVHYLSMCQGYAFGLRPQASGGIGLLFDHDGDDNYKADIFGQGSAYWFGLGMLVDRNGNDRYECFEHCQGEALHLGAGILSDWKGKDTYTGYEHAQGVGVDRAAGILYDNEGNDVYRSDRESQGAGIKPFGVGMLLDITGDDRYETSMVSQGYSARPPLGFPDDQWPLGILLDLGGQDVFQQPGVATPASKGRIQNRQGIAVDR